MSWRVEIRKVCNVRAMSVFEFSSSLRRLAKSGQLVME